MTDNRKRGLRTPDALEHQAGWHPKDPGHSSLCACLVPAGRWVCWPVLPTSQLALSTLWLAPQPLGWAMGLPAIGMGLAVWSRWAGRSIGCPQSCQLADAWAPLGWHHHQDVREQSQVLPGWMWKRTDLLCSGICLGFAQGQDSRGQPTSLSSNLAPQHHSAVREAMSPASP